MHAIVIIAAGVATMVLGGYILKQAGGEDTPVQTAIIVVGSLFALAGVFVVVAITVWFVKNGKPHPIQGGDGAQVAAELVRFGRDALKGTDPKR